MIVFRAKGFQVFRDKKPPYKLRCYHRSTRISVDLEKFPLGSNELLAEISRITLPARKTNDEKPGTLGMLFAKWRSHSDYTGLSERTRLDYQKRMDYLLPIGDTPLGKITPVFVIKLRDKAEGDKKAHFANYLIRVLSSAFNWGVARGYLSTNPAAGLRAIKRPKNAPEANRPWTDVEREAVLAAMPPHMLLPIGLMMFCALDPQDAILLPRTALTGGEIDSKRGKTGEPVWLPLPAPLKAIVAQAPEHNATTACANSYGHSWSISGFSSSWQPIKKQLEERGEIGRKLTLKGLRHTVATIASEMGFDERAVADLLGQKTTAMARHYARRADKRKKNTATITAFETELDERRTKTVKP
jgi:integrase